jgi:parallel beta-helix repeat protein
MLKVLKIAILAFFAVAAARTWAVTNAVVGACYPGTQFSAIQSAINAADPGSTVRICYGTYPEQLTINKPLTLLGYSTQTLVVIAPPAGGVVPNANSASLGSVAAQIFISSTGVNLTNLAIDAGGGLCTTTAYQTGVFYQYGSGTVRDSAFRNGPACAGYVALYAENTASLTVTSSALRSCLTCIRVINGANTTVSNNVLGPGDSVPGFTGIDVDTATGTTTVTGNTVYGMQIDGIRVHKTSNAVVTHNTIPELGSTAILLDAADHAKVQYNRITNGDHAITIDDHGVSGYNVVTLNVILDSSCAMSVGATLNDTVTPNYIYVSQPGYCL